AAKALLPRGLRHVGAQLAELALGVARGATDRRRDLDDGLHQLGVDPRLELVTGDRRQHGVDVLDEIERVLVEEHVLLLDAERVRLPLAELVVEDAAAGREARALAGDARRRELVRHPASSSTRASSSISTSQRG